VPNFDDPRYLQQVIQKLQKDVAALKKATLPFLVHQKGALPGYMRAVGLNDPNQKGAMWSNYSNLGPGQGPYSAVTDTTGVIRAEWGNLAANGASPAQFGFRANDANHVPIFDSLGLISVMQSLGREQFGPSQTIGGGGGGTNVAITNSSLAFSLPRAEHVFALAMVLATISNGTGTTLGTVLFGVDGTGDGSNGTTMQWLGKPDTNPNYVAVTGFYFNSLAAGSHTINLLASLNPTTDSFFIDQYDIVAFQLGS